MIMMGESIHHQWAKHYLFKSGSEKLWYIHKFQVLHKSPVNVFFPYEHKDRLMYHQMFVTTCRLCPVEINQSVAIDVLGHRHCVCKENKVQILY